MAHGVLVGWQDKEYSKKSWTQDDVEVEEGMKRQGLERLG